MTAQNCCNILPGRFLCSMQFLRALGSFSSLEGHSVLPRRRGPHHLCLMAQLLNFSVDERLMEVGQVPAQHKLVPGLAFSEMWIHGEEQTQRRRASPMPRGAPVDAESRLRALRSGVRTYDAPTALWMPMRVQTSSRPIGALRAVWSPNRTRMLPRVGVEETVGSRTVPCLP